MLICWEFGLRELGLKFGPEALLVESGVMTPGMDSVGGVKISRMVGELGYVLSELG